MDNKSKKVRDILLDCLVQKNEPIKIDSVPKEPVIIVEGIVDNYAFHPERLAAHKQEIADIIAEMNPVFHKSSGGGWTFLNLCMDKNDVQWGEQINCQELVALAIATEQGGYCLPKKMWDALPGSVPYVWLGE